MASLTAEQLQEAKRNRAEERRQQEEAERRQFAEAQAEKERKASEEAERLRQFRITRATEIAPFRKRLKVLRENGQRINQLESVLEGVYVEMDKLCKKAPADEVTELALRRVNDVIKRGKELMEGDEFIDSIEQFVAAGERPEHRDVLFILGDLKQGIKRLKEERIALGAREDREKWNTFEDIEDESTGDDDEDTSFDER